MHIYNPLHINRIMETAEVLKKKKLFLKKQGIVINKMSVGCH